MNTDYKAYRFFREQAQRNSWYWINLDILKDVYNTLFFTEPIWINYFGEDYCIIGFSEDKLDYYWVAINNNEKKLKFITYLYKLKKSERVSKKWNKDERKNIKEFVTDYFKKNKNDNLIYLSDYINSYNYV